MIELDVVAERTSLVGRHCVRRVKSDLRDRSIIGKPLLPISSINPFMVEVDVFGLLRGLHSNWMTSAN